MLNMLDAKYISKTWKRISIFNDNTSTSTTVLVRLCNQLAPQATLIYYSPTYLWISNE